MKKIIGLFLIIFSLTSCYQNNNENIAYRITEQDLIPEGITYASTTNSFYISSIHKTKIVQIDAKTGKFKDFISSDILGLGVLGMMVDEKNQQLWRVEPLFKFHFMYLKVVL